jgi:hypothetical protein
VAQLEAQQKLQEGQGQRSAEREREAPMRGGDEGGGGGGSYGGSSGGATPTGHQSFYKTRLCIKYMQTGYCHKGGACTFAHGYEDLRQPGTPLSPGRAPPVSCRGWRGGVREAWGPAGRRLWVLGAGHVCVCIAC